MNNKLKDLYYLILVAFQIIGFFPAAVAQQIDSTGLVKPGASLVQVSKQFTFTEGPAVDRYGNIYFTDQPNNKIWEYDTIGRLSIFMDKTGRSNGMYFDKAGNLIACADENNQIWSISREKKIAILLRDVNGHKLNGPNDLWIDKKGGIYFTDPYYQRDYWERKKPDIDREDVYYLPKGNKQPVVIDSMLRKPNGIVGTPDGKYLYVADIGDNKTYRYQIGKNGVPGNRQLFVPQGSDGMILDEKGNLYITGRGVTIYDSTAKKLGTISIPSNWVGNICFGGTQRNVLFITASEAVYTLQMKVKGVE